MCLLGHNLPLDPKPYTCIELIIFDRHGNHELQKIKLNHHFQANYSKSYTIVQTTNKLTTSPWEEEEEEEGWGK
jgi:hypothetical protein